MSVQSQLDRAEGKDNSPKETVLRVGSDVKTDVKKPSRLKIAAYAVGGLFALAHVGLLGYLIDKEPELPSVPTINIPNGPYSSYKIKAGKDGYEIEFRADDPKVLESTRTLDLDKEKRGLFGGGSEQRTEYRRDEYTREGTRNIGGGAIDDGGKLTAKEAECLVADAGARSQGAMAGSAITAGVVVPAVASIPYVGWLAGGWALLLGQKAGSEVGSQVGSVFNDC
tara:strand:+ start:476 stop:1150 length:675 start_codon:yes stop_codon:yes gene_type:complete